MVPSKSVGVPINPFGTALRSGSKPNFGTNPYTGLKGGFDPGMTWSFRAYDVQPSYGMGGLKGCGCGPVSGCGCDGADGLSGFSGGGSGEALGLGIGNGLSGLAQSASLDQVIANAASWLGGVAQASLPASAAVPPAVGSTGAILNQLITYAPYILVAYLGYRLLK